MKFFRFLLLLGIFNYISCHSGSHDEELTVDITLQRLAILHRHGDRSPIHTYAKDPYGNESYWPDGWGQLTMRGKRRLYALGKFIRKRYASFLTDNPGEVKVRSSAANRCLNSVQSLLAGAYPPKGDYIIEPTLIWQPFPVQTMPRPEDSMLNPGSYCPAAYSERDNIRKSPEVVAYTEKIRELLHYLSSNTGDKINDVLSAEYLRDCLFIEQSQGWPLPAWATDKVMEELKDISDMSFYFAGMTKKIQRLRTGVFFKDLVEHFETHARGIQIKQTSKSITERKAMETLLPAKQQQKQSKRQDEDDTGPTKKLFLYSTHDTMVSVLLQALNQYNMLAPPYAATLIFELHKHCFNSSVVSCSSYGTNEHFYVKIFYLNETDTEVLHPILPLGCQSTAKCPLDNFVSALRPLFIHDWESECAASGHFFEITSLPGMCTIEELDAPDLPFVPLESFIPEPYEKNHESKRDSLSVGSIDSDSKSSVSCRETAKTDDPRRGSDKPLESNKKPKKCFLSKNSAGRSLKICLQD
jgi:hypothetical protein